MKEGILDDLEEPELISWEALKEAGNSERERDRIYLWITAYAVSMKFHPAFLTACPADFELA